MNQYFVIDANTGQKYGPATADTLTQWAAEGRLSAGTIVEDATTGSRMPAGQVPGIIFATPSTTYTTSTQGTYGEPTQGPGGPQPYQPYQTPTTGYERPAVPTYGGGVSQQANNAITQAWIGMAVGCVCCGIFGHIFALIRAIEAERLGHPQGSTAKIISIVLCVLSVIGTIVYFVFMAGTFATM